ncbi:hypothetical protein [Kribbella italica]|uniref:Uncharacterized protein n=1 Tax=Kribbella italica TaxID=1540520 RepID=A0A7W9JCW5_9ACTN|nr:hypothetical protein [Kribbella italica]MBB5839645.1 hypothetical protein [Kribbella italica]
MRNRTLALAAAVVAVTGLTVPAQAAVADRCFDAPVGFGIPGYVEPYLADKPLQMPVALTTGYPSSECTGLTATVEAPNGARTTVALDKDGESGYPEPPIYLRYGTATIPLATGAGLWRIVAVNRGAEVRAVNVSLRVYRKVLLTLDQPARTSGSTKTVATGTARRYTAQGTLAPMTGSKLTVHQLPYNALLGSGTVDASGRYAVPLPITQATRLYTQYSDPTPHYYPTSDEVVARKLLAMSYLKFAATTKVGSLWSVSGTAFPGKLHTELQIYTGKSWVYAGSAGDTAANGSYARYWKPTRAGYFRLRVVVSGPGLDNSPWNREAVVTVR